MNARSIVPLTTVPLSRDGLDDYEGAARPAAPQSLAPDPIYRAIKTYDHAEGLSCCFRQWRAIHSHCRLIHGYALAFQFTFATTELDQHHWSLDFGGLKPLKAWLKSMFDHTMLVAEDDPKLARFEQLAEEGLIDLRVVPAIGCEATARYVFDYVSQYVGTETAGRVWLESVEVREHGGNAARYSAGPCSYVAQRALSPQSESR